MPFLNWIAFDTRAIRRWSSTIRACATLLCLCIAGLPVAAAKQVVGEVADGTYTAPNGRFTVAVPYPSDSPLYERMEIKERLADEAAALSFTIPGSEHPAFRLELISVLPTAERGQPLRAAAMRTFDWYLRRLGKAYQANPYEILLQELDLGGHRAVYGLYKQFAASGDESRYHLFYLVDYNTQIGFFWVEVTLPSEDTEAEESVVDPNGAIAARARRFARSLQPR